MFNMTEKFQSNLGYEHYNCDKRARLPRQVLNFLFNYRINRMVNMIDFPSNNKFIALDLGCSGGYLTTYLTSLLNGMVIGIDVYGMREAKMRARQVKPASRATAEFVCSDITQLPFRADSINLVVCASVLEHVNDLEKLMKEINGLMSENAILIAGYPIETGLFNALIRIFLPTGWWLIRDPRILGKKEFDRNPETHKQSFRTIRCLLQKHFLRVKREKSFFTILPDQMSWYECVKMSKKSLEF